MCRDGSNYSRFNQKELLTLPVPDVVSDDQEEIVDEV